jgi:hypothetical protein
MKCTKRGKDSLDLEMEEALKNARPLSEIDLERLGKINHEICCDPRHIAAVKVEQADGYSKRGGDYHAWLKRRKRKLECKAAREALR